MNPLVWGSVETISTGNNVNRMITSNDAISKVADSCNELGGYSADRISANETLLNNPTCFSVQSNGEIYISDTGNRKIRKVSFNGIISIIAGISLVGTASSGEEILHFMLL